MPLLIDAQTLAALNAVTDWVDPRQQGSGFVAFQVSGTWVGTITFQCAVDDADGIESIQAAKTTDGSVATTTTGNGIFRVVADGLKVRAKMTAFTSGSAKIRPSIGIGG